MNIQRYRTHLQTQKNDTLRNYFSSFWCLSDIEAEALTSRAIEKRLTKKEFILTRGEICRHFNFVVSGCVKLYTINADGKKFNLQFATENQWVTDYASFYREQPSELFIEALEPTTLLQIKDGDIYFLYGHYPIFDRNFRIIIENAFIEQQTRVLQNISSTSEERYQHFMQKYPGLINRISNVEIASYIGVTPEFLSVIRKRLSKGT